MPDHRSPWEIDKCSVPTGRGLRGVVLERYAGDHSLRHADRLAPNGVANDLRGLVQLCGAELHPISAVRCAVRV